MNSETKILKDRLEEIRNTLLELERIKKDIQKLINSNEEHRKDTISESKFFYRLYLNYTRLFVIDIYKLIGKKEDHNIQKLLDYCKTNINRIEWYNSISLEKLNLLSNKLNDISVKFEEIEGLRNKYYAHNDKNKQTFSFKLSLTDLWETLEGLQKIFSEINVEFDNLQWLFDYQYTSPAILQNISKYNKIRALTLSKHRELNPCVNTNDLLGIIRKR